MHGMIVDWVAYNASTNPDKLAVMELPSRRTQTYSEMHNRVGRVANWLRSLGVSRGDRVGVLAHNSTDILDILFATWRIGAIHLALNFRLTAQELDYILGDAKPRVLIHDEAFAGTAGALSVKIDHMVGTTGIGTPSAFETAISNRSPILEMVELQPDDMSMLMYSSGTTGRPKGVIITHGMMLWAQICINAPSVCTMDMVNLAVMPLFHIAGLQVFTCPAIFCGGTAIVMRAFDPEQVLAAFNDPQMAVTHFIGVPAIYNALKDLSGNSEIDFSRLRVCKIGAEAAPVPLIKWWRERGVKLREGYGMTETAGTGVSLSEANADRKQGSVGKPMRHLQIRIMKNEGGEALSGESGEIWFRGPVVTPGYWNNPQANEEAYVNGWFRTGDIGTRDEDGFIYIQDRLKDMYISTLKSRKMRF